MMKAQLMAYSLELRVEAPRQLQARTNSSRRLAQVLETLRNLRRDARLGAYVEPSARAPSMVDENRELRRENARLREERVILRRATAFFATDAR